VCITTLYIYIQHVSALSDSKSLPICPPKEKQLVDTKYEEHLSLVTEGNEVKMSYRLQLFYMKYMLSFILIWCILSVTLYAKFEVSQRWDMGTRLEI
jgi:hypothetical protein